MTVPIYDTMKKTCFIKEDAMIVYIKKICIMVVLSLFIIVCPSKIYGSTSVEAPKMPYVSSVTDHTIKI